MSLFAIKIIALVSMLLDHMGVFLYPQNILFRLAGRITFPLFAWAIANGAMYTRNIYKYLIRLFVLAVVSQIPYLLIFRSWNVYDPGLNILFTLSLGLLGIILIKKTNNLTLQVLIASLFSLIAVVVNSDYGAFGVLSIIVFYSFYKNKIKMSLSYIFLVIAFYLFPLFLNRLAGNVFEVSYLNIFEIISILSLLIISFYNHKIGYKLKYFFYIFYPVHLLFLYLARVYFH